MTACMIAFPLSSDWQTKLLCKVDNPNGLKCCIRQDCPPASNQGSSGSIHWCMRSSECTSLAAGSVYLPSVRSVALFSVNSFLKATKSLTAKFKPLFRTTTHDAPTSRMLAAVPYCFLSNLIMGKMFPWSLSLNIKFLPLRTTIRLQI